MAYLDAMLPFLVSSRAVKITYFSNNINPSTLEAVINQWNDYLEWKNQLEQWMESVDQKVEHPLKPQPGLKEKFCLLDHFQCIVSEGEDHAAALHRLTARSRELYQKTEDPSFTEMAQEELKTQFNDIMTVAKVSALY